MKRFLRRLRGVIGTALTWAFGWAAAFSLLNVGMAIIGGYPIRQFALSALVGGFYGFIAGGSFAVILTIAEGRRTLHQLSLKRVALWGGIGGAVLVVVGGAILLGAGFPVDQIAGALLTRLGIVAVLGAGSASGSVALARKASTGLIEGEKEPLLLE